MVKVPVVWLQYSGAVHPFYAKGEGDPFFVIGEEGENVLRVTRPHWIVVPIFEVSSTEEGDIRGDILERMLAVAECCVMETGKVGTIYGIFRSSYQLLGFEPRYIKEVGLGCTASEFKPSGERLNQVRCEELGLPWELEIEDQVLENHGRVI